MFDEKKSRIAIISLGAVIGVLAIAIIFLLIAKGPNTTLKEFVRNGFHRNILGAPSQMELHEAGLDGNDGADGKNGESSTKKVVLNAIDQSAADGNYMLSPEERELIANMVLESFKESDLVYSESEIRDMQLIGSDEIEQIVYSETLKEFLNKYIDSYINTKYSILNYLTEESIISGEQYDMDAITSYVASALIKNQTFLNSIAKAIGTGSGESSGLSDRISGLESKIKTVDADSRDRDTSLDKELEEIKKIANDAKSIASNAATKTELNKVKKDIEDEMKDEMEDLDEKFTQQITNILTEVNNLYDEGVCGASYVGPDGDDSKAGGTVTITPIAKPAP